MFEIFINKRPSAAYGYVTQRRTWLVEPASSYGKWSILKNSDLPNPPGTPHSFQVNLEDIVQTFTQ